MLSLSDLKIEYLDHTVDSSAVNIARGLRRMNRDQTMLCAAEDYYWLEGIYTKTVSANTQTYDFPIDYRKIKEAYITVNNIDYPLEEMVDPSSFDRRNALRYSERSDITIYFHIRNKKLYLYPIPSTTGGVVTILYIKRPKPMALYDYTTGTIAVTNGSAVVTGTGTAWASTNVVAGGFIQSPNTSGDVYEVLSRDSATQITLTQVYQGTTASGLDYRVGDMPLIPHDFQDILWMKAAEEYWARKDKSRFQEYQSMRMELEARLKTSTRARSTSNYWTLGRSNKVVNPNLYPRNIG